MNNTYARACTEVLEILNHIPKEEYERIPNEKIEFYKKHKESEYVFKYDDSKSLKEQNVSMEAQAIIVTLFRDYFATDLQKEKLKTVLRQNEAKKQKELSEKYCYDNLFKKHKEETTNAGEHINKEQLAMTEYKDTIWRKFINLIKKIIKGGA